MIVISEPVVHAKLDIYVCITGITFKSLFY